MDTMPVADPVGLVEVAERLDLARQTVTNLRWASTHGRGGERPFPPHRWVAAGKVPLWDWRADIEPWAVATGRLDAPEANGPPPRLEPEPPEPDVPVVSLVVTRERPQHVQFELRWGDRVRRWPHAVPSRGSAERKAKHWLDEQLGEGAYSLEMP